MEYIVGLIIALAGGLLYYKSRADKASSDAALAETRGRDRELADQQREVERSISEMDAAIADIREERKKRREAQTDEERAREWER